MQRDEILALASQWTGLPPDSAEIRALYDEAIFSAHNYGVYYGAPPTTEVLTLTIPSDGVIFFDKTPIVNVAVKVNGKEIEILDQGVDWVEVDRRYAGEKAEVEVTYGTDSIPAPLGMAIVRYIVGAIGQIDRLKSGTTRVSISGESFTYDSGDPKEEFVKALEAYRPTLMRYSWIRGR